MAKKGFMKAWTRGAVDGVGEGLASVVRADAALGVSRSDSFDTAALQLQLEQIKTQLYMRKKPPRQFLQFVPMDTSGGKGLRATGFNEGDDRADWKPMGDKSSDFSKADAKIQKHTFPVMSYFSGYGWWLRELEMAMRAQMNGLPLNLNLRKAQACRDAYDELVENHCLYGDPDYELYGFFNHPDIPRKTEGTALTSSTSAADLLDKLIDIAHDVESQSDGIEMAGALLIPGPMHRQASRTFFASTDTTVAQRFTQVTGFSLGKVERFKSIDATKLKDGGGAGTTSVAIAGSFSPENVEKQVPRPFEQLPAHVQSAGLETVVPCLTDLGGLHVYHPNAFKIYSNIYS